VKGVTSVMNDMAPIAAERAQMNPLSLWSKHRWWADGLRAPPPRPPRPVNPVQNAEQRWEDEGGPPPIGDPPDENPHRHL
jgi:hypothetical protein